MTTPTDNSIITKIKVDYNWLIHHLILLLITGGLVVASVYGVENLIAKHDVVEASHYAQILAAQTTQTQMLQKQLAADEQQWSEVEKSLLNENAKLSATISQQAAQVAQQRKTDETLSAEQAAARLSQQTNTTGEIIAQGNSVLADLPAARTIVSNLDLLAGTQSQLTETQKELTNETTIATDAKAESTEKDLVINGLTTQNKDEVTSCNAQIAAIKATDRKSKIKIFLKGVATGVVIGFIGKRLILGKW